MLFTLLENFRAAMQSIIAYRFRSFLTTLSIVIGVASIITIIALMEGFSRQLTEQFKGLGTNSLTITPYTPFKEALQGKKSNLTHADMEQIVHKVDGIGYVTPLLNIGSYFQGTVGFKSNNTFTQIYGTTINYQSLYERYPNIGRFLSPLDNVNRRRICVIGSTTKKNLQLPDDPIGEYISLGGHWLKVVGVMEERGELLGFSQDDYVLLPYSTARSVIGEALEASIDSIALKVDDMNQLPRVKDRLKQLLRQQHNIKLDEDDDFKVSTAEQLMDSVNFITGMFTLVLVGIVGVSLIVGGIGIMNIMLVSVVERTREIGICKALGATRSTILLQFLFEGFLLSLFGGMVGVLLGYGIAEAIVIIIPALPDIAIPLWSIFLSVSFAGAIGVIFGIVPASKAANLNPIDALRYE